MDDKPQFFDSNLQLLKRFPRDQFEAGRKILLLGGTVWPCTAPNDDIPESISFTGPKFTDAELQLLNPFRGSGLASIGCGKTNLTNKGIARMLADFPKAKSVGVMEDHATDAALAPLKEFSDLDNVKIRGRLLTSACLQHLAHQPNLAYLGLSETAIDDQGLRYLENLGALKWLSLDGTKVTTVGLASLGRISSLETLVINDLQVDDDGLKHLEPLQKLQTLRIDGTNITNRGMASVAKLLGLKDICVDRTKVDEQGIALLQNLPKLEEVRWVDLRKATVEQRRFDARFQLYLPANRQRWKEYREKLERGELTIDQLITPP